MEKTERHDFVEFHVQNLLDKIGEDIVVKYGYLDGAGKFVESDKDVNTVPNVTEGVFIRYRAGAKCYGVFQSIVADGYMYILEDIIKGIHKL